MRIQLALNVANLSEAIDYYSKLFGTAPNKIRDGYANFSIDSPALKLVLFENPYTDERLNHLGVEVFDSEQVTMAKERLSASGILNEVQVNETCCHATQDKVWSTEPQGLRWEWYRITNEAPELGVNASACCTQRKRLAQP